MPVKELNDYLRSKGLVNWVDGLRKVNGRWEWALIGADGVTYWFPIYRACTEVEKWLKAYDKLGGVNE